MRGKAMLVDLVFGFPLAQWLSCGGCGRVSQQASYLQHLVAVQVGRNMREGTRVESVEGGLSSMPPCLVDGAAARDSCQPRASTGWL